MKLSEILRAKPQQRGLWERLGIDLSRCRDCSLAEVCRLHDLDASTVARLLSAMREPACVILELLTLDELCEHIERRQHACLHDAMVELEHLTGRAAENPGGERFLKIRKMFLAFRFTLATHLHEESSVLFPCLRRGGEFPGRAALKFRLARLEREHCQADEALAELGALADGKIGAVVARLHRIVHEQIYIENRILFPQALACRGTS